MASPLSDAELEHTLRVVAECGGNQTHAAQILKLSRPVVRDRIDRARMQGMEIPLLISATYSRAEPGAAAPDAEIDLHSHDQRRIRFLESELSRATSQLKISLARADAAEDIRQGVLGLGAAVDADKLAWPSQKPSMLDFTVMTPLLFSSDFQCGEVVKGPEVDGMNVYNKDVFSERYQSMIEAVIDIAENWVGLAEFPGIVYCRGGDAISGEIHFELTRTNDLSAVPAVRWLLSHEVDGIKRLVDRFGRVRVVSIPGNHGRTDLKSTYKGYTERNFETILSLWLEHHFSGDTRVEFVTPASGDAYMDVAGWKFVLSHGDRMGSRGGTGFIGPIATIARGHRRIYENWTKTGRVVDYVLTGHLHTSCRTEFGYGNGSLIGYNEFARDHRITPDCAKQLLLFVHEKHGIAGEFDLKLSNKPNRGEVNAHAGSAVLPERDMR